MSVQQEKVDKYLASKRFLLSAGSAELRERSDLCPVCRGQRRSEYPYCYQCGVQARSASNNGWTLADRTAFICYGNAKGMDQLGSDMFTYKREDNPDPGARNRISSLLFHTLTYYWDDVNNIPISTAAVVPSTRGEGRNQLCRLVDRVLDYFPDGPSLKPLLAAAELRHSVDRQRTLNPELFVATDTIHGHILLIEDSWVTGANAQSAAAALHAAGADYVTVLSIARLLYGDVINEFQLSQHHRFVVGGLPEQSPFWSDRGSG